jgi:hypothetical protein
MQKQIFDCATGQVELVDMTAAEIAALAVQPVPASCTRTQCLLALLNSGLPGMSDPVGTITAAINAVADVQTRTALLIRFDADRWQRADLEAEAPMLGLTVAQIDALLVAAQNY